jgi:hypothetical protein
LPNETYARSYRATFSTKKVEKAIRTLDPILGRSNVGALIRQLQTYGYGLTGDERAYDLARIQEALEELFGEEAMLLLLRHITNELFEKAEWTPT